jgi:hypothetical protein
VTVTGLYNGLAVQIAVQHPELPPLIDATFVGWAGGPDALVKLAGTNALVSLPKAWIRKRVAA